MVTRTHLRLAAGLAILALAAWLTPASLAASYPTPSPQASAIQYVYFDPATPPSPGTSGWNGNGKYMLPPDVGAVTASTMAFGSIQTDASGLPSQAFVVRLTLANNGKESMTIDPSTVKLVDKAGRLLTGPRAFSGNARVTSDTVGPGGSDTLQLEFPLPQGADIRTLEIEDVDLPYAYGNMSYETRLGFALAASKETLYAPPPQAASAAPVSYPAESNYYTYYNAPYDTSGYTTGLSWQPGWGWWWYPTAFAVFPNNFRFFGDGDFDRDDFGRHHEALGATTTARTGSRVFGSRVGSSVGTGSVRTGEIRTGNLSTEKVRTFGTPRTTTSSTPRTSTLAPRIGSFNGPSASTLSVPHASTFSAPRTSTFSAPRTSTFSAPHVSGGGGGRGRR